MLLGVLFGLLGADRGRPPLSIICHRKQSFLDDSRLISTPERMSSTAASSLYRTTSYDLSESGDLEILLEI